MPWTFIKNPASTRCWWTHPAWSVVNRLDRPIWITIYNSPGGMYRLRAESIPDGKDFDVSIDPASFSGGWGVGTFSKSGTGYGWSINPDPRPVANEVIALPQSTNVVEEPPKISV